MVLSYKKKKLVWIMLTILICFNVVAWVAVYDLSRPKLLEITYFDIGQGDSIFIETPQGHQILIDGGPSSIILEKLAKEMGFYDKTIDLIILTHPEHDHYFGLLEVLNRYEVKNILWTGIVRDTAEWEEWIKLINQEEAQIFTAQAGQKIILQQDPYIFMDVLHPFENLSGKEFKRANDTSVVVHLFFEDVSFLLTGDISKKIELELIEQKSFLETDVLKVAHHGSKNSSSWEFLELSSPELAIIQAGKDNRYGHPHIDVLARLKEFGIDILRTDLNGDIKIVSDGNNFKILNK